MKFRLVLLLLLLCVATALAQDAARTLSGRVVTNRDEVVPGATITVKTSLGEKTAISDATGHFSLPVPREDVIVKLSGKNIAANETTISANAPNADLRFEIAYIIPQVHDSLV